MREQRTQRSYQDGLWVSACLRHLFLFAHAVSFARSVSLSFATLLHLPHALRCSAQFYMALYGSVWFCTAQRILASSLLVLLAAGH